MWIDLRHRLVISNNVPKYEALPGTGIVVPRRVDWVLGNGTEQNTCYELLGKSQFYTDKACLSVESDMPV